VPAFAQPRTGDAFIVIRPREKVGRRSGGVLQWAVNSPPNPATPRTNHGRRRPEHRRLDRTVTLYNPWAHDGTGGAMTGADDGVITLTWAQFAANFTGYYRRNG
jgi:hypothetical protein